MALCTTPAEIFRYFNKQHHDLKLLALPETLPQFVEMQLQGS